MDGMNGASLLVDLDAGFAARQSVLENRRRVVSWAKDYVEEVAGLGFAVTVDVDGADLVIRIGGVQEIGAGPTARAPVRPAPQDLADLAAALDGNSDDVPAQEAQKTPAAETCGGGEAEQVAAAPVQPAAAADNVLPLSGYGTPWSEAEDTLLVDEVVKGLSRGLSMRAASLAAAKHIGGRTEATVEQRVRQRLKVRVEDAHRAAIAVAGEVADLQHLPLWQRMLSKMLDRIGQDAPFSPKADLAIVEGLTMGQGPADVAMDAGVTAAEVKARFSLLCPEKTIAAQQNLLTELRRRVALAERVQA